MDRPTLVLKEFVRVSGALRQHRPWPRAMVTQQDWSRAAEQLADGHWTLLGLWGEPDSVHMAVLEETSGDIAVLSLECPRRTYPSVARHHPPALRLERALRDLFGLKPQGLPDARPWFDHGCWDGRPPLAPSRRAAKPASGSEPYPFLQAEGPGLHQIPVGPVHAGIIEPGHFRFTASGETVVRLEARLGYTHKGVESLMSGADLARGAQLAQRTCGDSTVAYAYAFAQAAEAALRIETPARAVWLRALMAELERLANHLGDIGAVCNDAAFALMHAHCGVLREHVLRAADAAFGHRFMRDRIVPGGVTRNLDANGVVAIRALLVEVRRRFPPLVELYDNTASLQDRTVATGILAAGLARQYGAGGYVGRASGRAFDVRRAAPYGPYGALTFDVPVLEAGDVNARVWIRIREVGQSLSLVEQILDGLPDGPLSAHVPDAKKPVQGMALVEGFRGDVLVWLSLARDGRIARAHLRDPSWFQWPLLEAAIEGNIVADFPLCNKSFNCSYSGHDL